MYQLVISCGKIGSGPLVTISTVKSSTLRIALAVARVAAICEVRARSKEKTTSSAVNGGPSRNFSPWRSLQRQTSGAGGDHSVATAEGGGSSLMPRDTGA